MALGTVLGGRPQGFFIPYRYADRLPPAGARLPYAPAEAALAAAEPAFAEVLEKLGGLAAELRAIGALPPPEPRWNQDWFPTLDAAVAYAMVRWLRPRRVVEVGSGHSTRFLARAVRDGGLGGQAEIVAIDPAPRAGLPEDRVRLVRASLAEAGDAPFAALEAGDMLLIDSSHILMPGSDVDHLLNRILPALPPGVAVQVHDVFLPDDYPAEWAWRGYNEQLGVAPLLAGGGWQPLFASHYVATRMAGALAHSAVADLPTLPGARPAALWLLKS